jgi:hypothetical protein
MPMESGTTRIARASLGDWGSRVQISPLRPKIPQQIKVFVYLSGSERESEITRTKPDSGGSSGHRPPKFPPESVALCSHAPPLPCPDLKSTITPSWCRYAQRVADFTTEAAALLRHEQLAKMSDHRGTP